MNLSKRLKLIAKLITPCKRLIDVGCDHGYLAAWLLQEGKVETAILTDINKKPYLSAQKLIKAEGLSERAQVLLCSGLGSVELEPQDALVIAGIGALVICNILEDVTIPRGTQVLLQPTWNREILRRQLARRAYTIEEHLVYDKQRIYSIFRLFPDGEPRELSLLEASLGEDFAHLPHANPQLSRWAMQDLIKWYEYLERVYSKKQRSQPSYEVVANFIGQVLAELEHT